jgi:hypothetical protein
MQALRRIMRELIGLFIDDGSLAVVVVIWIAICAVVLPILVPTASWQGPIMFVGLALILLESVTRRAKQGIKSD